MPFTTLESFEKEYKSFFNFSPEILEMFPEVYKIAFSQVMMDYKNAKSNLQKLESIQTFSRKFTLLPEMWKLMENLEQLLLNEKSMLPSGDNIMLTNFRKRLTFSSKKYKNEKALTWKLDSKRFSRCFVSKEWNDYMYEPEKLLNFPHKDLPDALRACKRQSVRPIDEKVILKHERLCQLYKEFMRDDLSHDEWVRYLNEIEDKEVIIGLFEHRLGWKRGCLDKYLWKMYMDFLKDKDLLAYLNVYRRYTRFFVEDKEMVAEYRSEIERISKIPMPVAEFWIDTILYELDFSTIDSAIEILKQALGSDNLNIHFDDLFFCFIKYFEIIKNQDPPTKNREPETLKMPPKSSPISCYYPRSKIEALKKTQNFSFHRTYINYITQNSKTNHQLLQKLFHSCKYFFAIQPTPLCHRLVLGCIGGSQYRGQSLFLDSKDLDFAGLDNLYVTEIFDIAALHSYTYSKTYPRLYKCDAKYGKFFCQTLTIKELTFIHDWREIISFQSKIIHEGVTYEFYETDLLNELYLKNL